MKNLFIFAAFLCGTVTGVGAATGEILDNDAAVNADVSTLRAEADVFETIRRGMMLTISECEVTSTCSLNVNSDEIHQLVSKLDARITAIAERHSESEEAGLEEILLTYVDARDGYNEMLDKLATMPQAGTSEEEGLEQEDIFNDTKEESAGKENKDGQFNNLFEDIDEDL